MSLYDIKFFFAFMSLMSKETKFELYIVINLLANKE